MGVGRIVEVGSRARKAGCRLKDGLASGMGVYRKF
jgi:hypothetical protein